MGPSPIDSRTMPTSGSKRLPKPKSWCAARMSDPKERAFAPIPPVVTDYPPTPLRIPNFHMGRCGNSISWNCPQGSSRIRAYSRAPPSRSTTTLWTASIASSSVRRTPRRFEVDESTPRPPTILSPANNNSEHPSNYPLSFPIFSSRGSRHRDSKHVFLFEISPINNTHFD